MSVRSRKFSRLLQSLRFHRFSSDAKSKEDEDWLFPRVKKYLPVLVPLVIVGSCTAAVVANSDFRYTIEAYYPEFIDFIRNNVGFTDEDQDDRTRVKARILEQNTGC